MNQVVIFFEALQCLELSRVGGLRQRVWKAGAKSGSEKRERKAGAKSGSEKRERKAGTVYSYPSKTSDCSFSIKQNPTNWMFHSKYLGKVFWAYNVLVSRADDITMPTGENICCILNCI
jgi:hypothetical protein